MAENIKLGWLEDYDEVKFAPKTFSEQILNADGTSYEVSVQNKIDAINAQISNMQGGTTIVNAANKLNVADTGDTDTPIYFKDGVPIVCTSLDLDTSGNAATATAWKEIRRFSIEDYSGVNSGSPIQVDGTADTILLLPKTIEAETFMGDLNGNAATADKINSSLSINGKTFDGSTAVDVDIIGTTYGGTGNATGRVQIGQEAGEQIGINATSEGNDTIASGNYSHAEGDNTTASGDNSHAEGCTTVAQGGYSHAEGINTVAVGFGGHAEGNGSKTTGNYSHAEGENTRAIGNYSHSGGYQTTAYGEESFAHGFSTSIDSVDFSTATFDTMEGAWNRSNAKFLAAYGKSSHAEGSDTFAYGEAAHAEGNHTLAQGNASHAEGFDTEASGDYSHAEGDTSYATGAAAHAEGGATAHGYRSHAEGASIAQGDCSHAEGINTTASGDYSHASGYQTSTLGQAAHSEGYSTRAISYTITTDSSNSDIITAWNSTNFSLAKGEGTHVEGKDTLALNDYSHAEGQATQAIGVSAHSEGYKTQAIGNYSHAEGTETTAIGVSAHSEGSNTTAHGKYSHAEGGSEVTFATLLNKYNREKNTNFSLDSMSHSNIYNVWKFGQETTDYAALAYKSGHSEGYNNLAIDGHAEGDQTYANLAAHAEGCGTEASGLGSHAEGEGTSAIGMYSHAEGRDTTTYYPYAHAEGTSTRASRDNAHAEGFRSVAEGISSHAEGSAFARGDYSHAEGKSSFFPIYLTGSNGIYTYSVDSPDLILEPGGIIIVDNLSYNIETVNKESNEISIDFLPSEQWENKKGLFTYFGALGYCSHVEGDSTKATGSCAHASGLRTEATGRYSWAHGSYTIANGDNQMVIGEYNVADTTSAFIIGNGTSSNPSNAMSVSWTGKVTASKVYGAVWNDYAEYRTQKEIIKPGYCVASADNGQVYKTTEKFQACDGIVSDTFGFAIGETNNCKTPLAVAGRVLAYCEGNRYDYHAGDTVCAGPEGKVVKMTREEIREWPDRIIGIVSEIPEYETWGTGNIAVNGRIWIKVK